MPAVSTPIKEPGIFRLIFACAVLIRVKSVSSCGQFPEALKPELLHSGWVVTEVTMVITASIAIRARLCRHGLNGCLMEFFHMSEGLGR
ncbi:MAG: hypothetical protein ONB44_10780 [candidate division KSB1 bacterium]|nr:hypothetical protein [candidate division KSB1 bacterium]